MIINNVNYHVEVIGKGEPLLLLHGFTGSMETFTPFIKEWSSKYKLIMIDIIGHGKTDKPKDYKRYDILKVSSDLKEILTFLKITKIHVFGYSMGGRLALSFSILYPDLVLSLILESSSPGIALEKERTLRVSKDENLADFIEDKGIDKFIEYWEKIPLFREDLLKEEIKINLHKQRLKNNPMGLSNSLRGMGSGRQPSWWDRLEELNIPVKLIVGQDDKKFCEIATKMREKLKDARIIKIPYTGHMIHLENPEEFSKVVVSLLTRR